ncbi:hypothetical protein PIB30_033740 [Stylosanthes scabra]|uniref:Uncharacterized protein n=1 Tax=Stylosanthes scabra TaxID=79078 RepID=A0ABU6QC90_9FABA|nr:hypothetical protein [Stylosanthes scabra]
MEGEVTDDGNGRDASDEALTSSVATIHGFVSPFPRLPRARRHCAAPQRRWEKLLPLLSHRVSLSSLQMEPRRRRCPSPAMSPSSPSSALLPFLLSSSVLSNLSLRLADCVCLRKSIVSESDAAGFT